MLYKHVPTSGSRRWLPTAAAVSAVFTLLALAWTASPVAAQVPQRYSIVIDATTTQPVGTGFWAPSATGDVIIFAEGALRGPVHPERFERGWFGPAGQDHFDDPGQPIHDGMPYGALIGGFYSNPTAFQFLGRMGTFTLQPAHVGEELRLSLNLSDADLATLDGQITVNVIYLPEGTAEASKFVINPGTPLRLGTGLIAAAGDQYVVLPRGRLRDPLMPNSVYSDGHFGPEGLLGLVSATQPNADGAYGALFGTYGAPNNDFYIGDGGCWAVQPSDLGLELQLLINADAASQAGMLGKFVVYVIRVPAPDPAGLTPIEGTAHRAVSFPSPISQHAEVRFHLDRDDHVRLRVFDPHGRSVRLLADETLPAGTHEIAWDGGNDDGRRMPSGAYFYQYSTRKGTETGRVVIVN